MTPVKASEKDLNDWLRELHDPTSREQAIAELSTLKTDKDELNGLRFFLAERNGDVDSLFTFLDNSKAPDFSKKKSVHKYAAWFAGIAASILLAIGIAYTAQKNAHAQFQAYLIYDPGLPVTMNATYNIARATWMQEYKSKNYDLAYAKGTQLLANEPTNDTLHYYQGLILLYDNEPQKALSHFAVLRTQKNSVYYVRATYYLALCTYALQNFTETRALLNEVSTTTLPDYSANAEALLQAIEE